MNRTLLLIAIAAIAAVGIAAGILLSASLGGPLAGSIAMTPDPPPTPTPTPTPAPTRINLSISGCSPASYQMIQYRVYGVLSDDRGIPLAGRYVTHHSFHVDNGRVIEEESGMGFSPTVVTGQDGSFGYSFGTLPSENFIPYAPTHHYVTFAGDPGYAGSTSNTVIKPC